MKITLVAHDIRSTHNVGAFFRTCDALGIDQIYFSGYTPYPSFEGDSRLPHFADKLTRQIHKTALGAESTVQFRTFKSIEKVIEHLQQNHAVLIALELFPSSITLSRCRALLKKKYGDRPIALFIGNEIRGIEDTVLKQMDIIVEIPMQGTKESLNVSVATGIALYELSRAI